MTNSIIPSGLIYTNTTQPYVLKEKENQPIIGQNQKTFLSTHNDPDSDPDEIEEVYTRVKTRKILPLTETPSLLYNKKPDQLIDEESTRVKTTQRIFDTYLTACLQKATKQVLIRDHTSLQGYRSTKESNLQSAHFSLKPSSCDHIAEDIKKSIATVGVSPTRTGPYLKYRLQIDEAEQNILMLDRTPEVVEKIFHSRLPKGGEKSSLIGSTFEKIHNAVYENPLECNMFDSLFERYIQPFCKKWDKEIAEGLITEQEYITEFLKKYLEFIDTSIEHNTQKIACLKQFAEVEKKVIAFENKAQSLSEGVVINFDNYLSDIKIIINYTEAFHSLECYCSKRSVLLQTEENYKNLKKALENIRILNAPKIESFEQFAEVEKRILSFEEKALSQSNDFEKNLNEYLINLINFDQYLKDLQIFIDLKKSLSTSGTFSPRCSAILQRRQEQDFEYLEQVLRIYEWMPKGLFVSFCSNLNLLKTPEKQESMENILCRYQILLSEASYQKEIVEQFLSCNHISNLDTLLFGFKAKDNQRRAPTAQEKTDQLFRLLKIATPKKRQSVHTEKLSSPSKKPAVSLSDKGICPRKLFE